MDALLAEMYGAAIPSLQLINGEGGSAASARKAVISSSNSESQPSSDAFSLDSLGSMRGVVETALAFFSEKLMAPLATACLGNATPPLSKIGTYVCGNG